MSLTNLLRGDENKDYRTLETLWTRPKSTGNKKQDGLYWHHLFNLSEVGTDVHEGGVEVEATEDDEVYAKVISKLLELNHSLELEQLLIEIADIFCKSNDIQNALVSLLGFGDFEVIEMLIANKHLFSDKPSMDLKELSLNKDKKKWDAKNLKEYLISKRINLLALGNRKQPLPKNKSQPPVEYPHVYRDFDSSVAETQFSFFDTSLMLPVGTVRLDTPEYLQIALPMPKSSPPSVPLVEINALDSWVRPVFKGYKSLNTIQSIVYPTAFKTNENMLVCAPTGAGKTDVALLTIMSTINRFRDHTSGTINKADFKIFYICPMKALATEITRKFSTKLQPLGITVREWTGDMQLTKSEISQTNILVSTPEKYDVISRKISLAIDLKIRLLILDEVHLLHDDRGSVLESIVVRTLRLVETTQSMIRLVGLSATLPNFVDVSEFLRVNPQKGLYYFGSMFRPVPLEQTFVGVKSGNPNKEQREQKGSTLAQGRMNKVAYDRALIALKEGRQVMIFVHSRKETVKTAKAMLELARDNDQSHLFKPDELIGQLEFEKNLRRSRNHELRELAMKGVGIHHAGMLRPDRLFCEKEFSKGNLRLLVCTATLAWGVNLPAYSVIIKGTQVFDMERGGFVDLSILDVLQIFGRAGRPQFEPKGVATIITTYDKLSHYVARIASQMPIESKFNQNLVDALNAEICATGSVSNIQEAVRWLTYSFLYVRMRKNPQVYGLQDWDPILDPHLIQHLRVLCLQAAETLRKCQMVQIHHTDNALDFNNAHFIPNELGRIAALYYITWATVELYNETMHTNVTEADLLHLVSSTKELQPIKMRESEAEELKRLLDTGGCPCQISAPETDEGKRNILIQAYISRFQTDDFGLSCDTNFIAQNIPRILRAFFEMTMRNKWAKAAYNCLTLAKSFEKRQWPFEHAFMQFCQIQNNPHKPLLPWEAMYKLSSLTPESSDPLYLSELTESQLGDLVNNPRFGAPLKQCAVAFPKFQMQSKSIDISKTAIQIDVFIFADFQWNQRIHEGMVEYVWVYVEESASGKILGSQLLRFSSKNLDPKSVNFIIDKSDIGPDLLVYVHAVSDRWVGSEQSQTVLIK